MIRKSKYADAALRQAQGDLRAVMLSLSKHVLSTYTNLEQAAP